jgi:hypothetical protein
VHKRSTEGSVHTPRMPRSDKTESFT